LVEDPLENDYEPNVEEIYLYCKYIILSTKMEKEIPIMALVYVERFLERTGTLMNKTNWRRFALITLIIASKVNHV
jgi:hypothetical protein